MLEQDQAENLTMLAEPRKEQEHKEAETMEQQQQQQQEEIIDTFLRMLKEEEEESEEQPSLETTPSSSSHQQLSPPPRQEHEIQEEEIKDEEDETQEEEDNEDDEEEETDEEEDTDEEDHEEEIKQEEEPADFETIPPSPEIEQEPAHTETTGTSSETRQEQAPRQEQARIETIPPSPEIEQEPAHTETTGTSLETRQEQAHIETIPPSPEIEQEPAHTKTTGTSSETRQEQAPRQEQARIETIRPSGDTGIGSSQIIKEPAHIGTTRPSGDTGIRSSQIIIHPLGVYNVDPHSTSPWIISPMHPGYRYWHAFMLLLVIYSALAYPFEAAFLKNTSYYSVSKLYYFDIAVDVCFLGDLFLTFFVGFFEPATQLLILDRALIAERYLTTWFIMDFASILPVEVVIYFITGTHTGLIISILSLLRLIRLRHVEQLFTRLEKDINFSYVWVRLVKMVCMILMVVYLAGCIYFYLAVMNPDQERKWTNLIDERSLFAWLILSIYWSMTTFTTVGYGDIHPDNETEMIYSIIYMLVALFFFVYITGNISEIVTEIKRPVKELRNSEEEVTRFGDRNQLPLRLREQALASMRLEFEAKSLNVEKAIEKLPLTVQNKIREYLYVATLERVYLFSGIDREASSRLATRLKGEYILPCEDVIVKNQDPRYVFIIQSGEVEIVNTNEEGKEQVSGVLRSNDIFGEVGAIRDRPESHTYRTRALTQVFRLKTKTLRREMQNNHTILRNFEQRHGKRGNSKGKATLEAEVSHLLRVSIYKGLPNNRSGLEGVVIELPSSMTELKKISGEIHDFDASEAIVRNKDGEMIDSISVIRDNDKLFIGD